MTASKPIFIRWSTATALVVSMSFSLMSAIDCSPKEWASLFILKISDADSGRDMEIHLDGADVVLDCTDGPAASSGSL